MGDASAPSRALRRAVQEADLIICADGGLRPIHALAIAPQVVIGDFDSVEPTLVEWARGHGSTLVPHPQDKDKTDVELALDHAIERGATEVDFFGVLGGRVDHMLANVALVTLATSRGIRTRIIDGRS